MSDEAWLDRDRRRRRGELLAGAEWRSSMLDTLADLVAELGRLRIAVEVLAGEALDRQITREAREASIEAHPSLGMGPPEYE